MTDVAPEGVAPIEPDEEFDEDAYEAMMDAMSAMIAEADEPLQEAFNRNQPRYPKGSPKAGQWRPKLTTGAGRVAPGHLTRDLAKLKDDIEVINNQRTPGQAELNRIGTEVEKIALRYSARKTYEKRIAELRTERTEIIDRNWDAYEQFFHHPSTTQEMIDKTEVTDLLSPEDAKHLRELSDEDVRLARDRDFADRDAMLGVLQKIRPMGGTLRQPAAASYAVDQASSIERHYIEDGNLYLGPRDQMPGLARKAMKDDLDKNLKQVLKVIPKAWLDDTNSKGEVSWLFSADRAWADTRTAPTGPPDEWKDARDEFAHLGEQGYTFLGVNRRYEMFLMFRAPDSDNVIALRRDGEIVKGVGDYANTPLVLDARGEMALPGYTELRPSAEHLRQYIKPMENLPPPRIESGSGGAMGPDWDPYKEMREGVQRYEREGWTFVGRRGKWATLRKDGKEVSLNWGGEPLTSQVGNRGAKDSLGPLDPYGQIPLPPLPVRQDTLIKIDPRPKDKDTLLHELSHRLEIVYGEENAAGYTPISQATHAFLDRRTRGEEAKRLLDLYPGTAYKENEVAKPDKFIDGYVGKQYPGQVTEVLTMGMQTLWFPRYGQRDINKDPEMRRLILGLLAAV